MVNFKFEGELVSGFTQEKAQRNLARLFGVSEAVLDGLFSGEYVYFREGLDNEVAFSYVELFLRAGAVGKIVEPETAGVGSETLSQKSTDLPPNSAANSNSGTTAHYGAHVAASLGLTENEPSENEKPALNNNPYAPQASQASLKRDRVPRLDDPRMVAVKKQNSAAKWLRIGGLAVVGTLIADEQLQSALIIDRYGLDLGYAPLILAHIPLLIGCYLLAREKRLSPIFGALGLLSFAGLSILMLIPPKGSKDHKIKLSAIMVTIFSCALFVFWLGGAAKTSAEAKKLHQKLATLKEGREEYPSEVRQSDLYTFTREQTELHDVMNEVILLANDGGLRPDDVSDLGEALMAELMRYIVWRQHQAFLYYTSKRRVFGNKKKVPEGLSDEFQEKDQSLFAGTLSSISEFTNERLNEAKLNWIIGPADETEFARIMPLRNQIDNIFLNVNEQRMMNSSNANDDRDSEPKPPVIKVSELALPQIQDATLTRFKNHVEYRFDAGRLQGKVLAVGFYASPYKLYWGGLAFSHKNHVLNSDVPAAYMSNIMSPFSDYQTFP